MKKINLLLFFVVLFFMNTNAQEVIASSGNYSENSSISISWTLGEVMTETYSAGTNILTQGFQQSGLTAVSVFEIKDANISISVAPNPTNNFINLYVGEFKNTNYELYDFSGKLIKKADLNSEKTEISFLNFSFGAYFLKINKNAQTIKTFQIIKQ